MRVRMLAQECGPNGNFAPGDERTVSEGHGRQLIEIRAAVDITPQPVEQAVIKPPEAAAVTPPEAAVPAPVETRKKGGRKR